MRFFITSEAYKTVGNKMSLAYTKIEPKIESLFINSSYGDGVGYWGHICICCPPEVYDSGFFKEIKKYSPKKKDLELRLRIDYEVMLKANEKGVFKLICESILSGVEIAENELNVKDFDFNAFRNELTNLFKKEEWL